MSCTESLGFESSDDLTSSFDDLGRIGSDSNDEEPSPSSWRRSRERGVAKRWEERRFPPPLTSFSENGRRNFVLKSVRKEGRLEIVGVMIDHPKILCATRDNGWLRMNLVKNLSNDDDEEEEEEVEETAEEEEDQAGERERRRLSAEGGMRRCYHHQVWGPQQHRYVTTV